MSGLRVSNLRGDTEGSSPTFPDGIIVSGVVTSTSFSGNLTGNVSGSISGTTATFSGDVSIGGTLTYEDVTNIDSVGVITARGGIEIGAGQSVSAVSGIITYYGDGSNLDGVESGVVNFVASGNIDNGATVIIKTDGTVGIITQTGSADPNVGTPVVYNNVEMTTNSVIYDSTNNKVVISYRDGSSGSGTAIVGTVSGSTITFGSATVFESSATSYITSTFDSSNSKVIVAYKDDGDNNKGKAAVGTVSGTSISFGTPVEFNSGSTAHISATYDTSNQKVVIAYRDEGNGSYGTVRVGTVSGTSISFGSEVVFESANTSYESATFDPSNNKVIIAYKDNGNSDYGTAIVGTVSGTSISFGSPVVFNSADTEYISSAFDSSNNKIVITYRDNGNSYYGTAIVGTVSGDSITFGSETVFESATSRYTSASYDSSNGKVVIAYEDVGNSLYGTAVVGTVSGTSISFGSPVVFESAQVKAISTTYDSNSNKVVIAYQDVGNSDYGTTVVFGATSFSTNLTTENYIGIAGEAISDGATGKINIVTGTNSGQTGLSTAQTYYVQPDGTLGTSAGSPSVVAGTAISDTTIIVQKS